MRMRPDVYFPMRNLLISSLFVIRNMASAVHIVNPVSSASPLSALEMESSPLADGRGVPAPSSRSPVRRYLYPSIAIAVLVSLAIIIGVAVSQASPHATGNLPTQYLHSTARVTNGTVVGTVAFRQAAAGDSTVFITVNITGLTPGLHGFHVHANADLSNACLASGAHYNPFNQTHGGPLDEIRHVGDLGNALADNNGVASFSSNDTVISLRDSDITSVVARALVIHALADDLGRGGWPDSNTTGHAGARIACAIITPV